MIAWAVLLYIAGVLLVFAEFFVPGGICGAIGGMAIVVSCLIACYVYPDYSLFIVIGQFLGALVCLIVGFKYLPRTSLGRTIILETSQQPEDGYVAAEGNEALLGREAETFTPMRPAGTILIDGKKYDAVAAGTHIEKGVRVKIIEVRGSRIVVEEVR